MSSSAECWEFSGGERKRLLEKKPSFSQTCSRLSRYLKEKGSFGDLSLGLTCNPDVNGAFGVTRQQPTMMNLFPVEASGNDSSSAAQDVKQKNDVVFPRQSSFSSSSSSAAVKEEVENITETKSVKVESQSSAPLTIFYGGQVMVFDDFPADKAKQVIDLAHKGSAKSFTTELNNKEIVSTTPNAVLRCPVKPAATEPVQTNKSSLASELPIARRASLHRFLEKRKDRITSKAPYQIDGPTEASSKPNTAWLGSQ